jgi:hypothetical protein
VLEIRMTPPSSLFMVSRTQPFGNGVSVLTCETANPICSVPISFSAFRSCQPKRSKGTACWAVPSLSPLHQPYNPCCPGFPSTCSLLSTLKAPKS